ncbi:ATP-binding protein [Gammaproteobacteria bacterium]|nr:ATP-binding protein [Gammaproteobacteria bacterium]
MWFRKKDYKNAGKKWTKDQENILLDGLAKNTSYEALSKLLDRSPSSIMIKYDAINKKRKSGSWTPAETLQLIDMWNDNVSYEIIGQKLNRKQNSISGRLMHLQTNRQGKSLLTGDGKIDKDAFIEKNKDLIEGNVPQYNLAPGTGDEIIKLALKGYELEHISEILGLNLNCIQEILDDEEIWDEYDELMLKKAEKRYFNSPKLGNERDNVDKLLKTREEEQKKEIKYISRLIEYPEGSNIEFKQTYSRCIHKKDHDIRLVHSVLKNICAFLNTRGGDLVIGVNDKTREIVGIDFDYYKTDEEYIRKVSTGICNAFKIQIQHLFTTKIVTVDNKKVCWINVLSGDEPAFLIYKDWNTSQNLSPANEIYYERQGDEAMPLHISDAMKSINRNWPNFFIKN